MEIGRDRENLFGEGILTEISLLGHGKNFSFFPFRENERGREEDRTGKRCCGPDPNPAQNFNTTA